ncbi:hypothetical protein [Herbidospora sp. RD11066]
MPKIDGMDPKLVRDLLAELRRAAKEMESIEAKVTTTVRNAGVPAAVTYRPSAVADAIAEMDKDVTARLALLEKRERDPATRPTPTTTGDETPTKPVPKPAPEPTGTQEQPKPTEGDTAPPKPTTGDSEPPKKSDTETELPKSNTESDPPKKSDTETEPPKNNTETDPPKKSDTETEPPKKSDTETEPPKNNTETEPPKNNTETDPPKKSDTETEPPKQCDDETAPPPKGEAPAPGNEPVDTPKKDHPDDIDQTRGRVEINVDGTKVVSTPLNLPDGDALGRIDGDLDTVRPVDNPGQSGGTQPSTGPQPDGKPGYVEPLEPTAKQPAPQPGLDPGDPMGAYVGTAADNVTEDPYLKNNPAAAPAPQPGLAPGDPMGDYVGTAADNVTEDPYLKDNPVTQPAPQPGLAPGDPMGDYVGTAADNVTEDPYLKDNPVTQPAPQPGLAPGDPMGDYVGTAADNVTEDPYAKDNPVTQPAPQPGLAPGDPMGDYVGTPADNATEDPYLQGNPANTLPEDTVLISASSPEVAPQIQAEVPLAGGEAIDPKALAAAQPGDVLSAPANQISDQALGALLNGDDQVAPQNMPTVTDGNPQPGGANEQTGNSGATNGPVAGGNGDAGNSPGGDDRQCDPQRGTDQPANGTTSGQNGQSPGSPNGQSGPSTGPIMVDYGPADMSADGQAGTSGEPWAVGATPPADQAWSTGETATAGYTDQPGSAGQSGAEIDPRRLAAEQPGDVLSAPANQISDQALTSLLDIDYQIGPQEMSSMATDGSGSEGGPGQAPSGGGSDQSGSGHADIDPKRLAAEQPGDVLSAPANPITDEALGALLGFDDQIAPQDMPSMTTDGSGSEGGPGQGPSGSGSDQSASGAGGQSGGEVDPKRLAAEQPGDVLSAPAKPITDEALGALLGFDDEIGPQEMPSMTAGGSGSEGGSGSDQFAAQAGGEVDPKRLAAEQPGDVLSAPANPVSDEAIGALMEIHGQIEPVDMPSVSVPEKEWGSGEWVPMDVRPDGPSGSVAPGRPA